MVWDFFENLDFRTILTPLTPDLGKGTLAIFGNFVFSHCEFLKKVWAVSLSLIHCTDSFEPKDEKVRIDGSGGHGGHGGGHMGVMGQNIFIDFLAISGHLEPKKLIKIFWTYDPPMTPTDPHDPHGQQLLVRFFPKHTPD